MIVEIGIAASCISFFAIVAFGNAGAIGAMVLVLVCSCIASVAHQKAEETSCGCNTLSLIAAKQISPECAACAKPLQTAFNVFCAFLSIVFVAIFIYAMTIR